MKQHKETSQSSRKFPLQYTYNAICSNENITKFVNLSHHECPHLVLNHENIYMKYRIRTTPHQDNSPSYRFWPWWVVLCCGSGPSGELSWWGMVPVGNGWALFLSGGELSLVGSCPRTVKYMVYTVLQIQILLSYFAIQSPQTSALWRYHQPTLSVHLFTFPSVKRIKTLEPNLY